MSALSFPTSPALYDSYSVGGQNWYWDGTTWRFGVSPGADPYFANVIELIPGRPITDVNPMKSFGSLGTIWFASNRVGANTLAGIFSGDVTPKFGSAAMMWGNANGRHSSQAGSYIIAVQTATHALGTGDFVIDWWMYPTTTGANQILYDTRTFNVNGVYPTIYIGTDNSLRVFTNSADRITSATTSLTFNAWNYCAWVRNSGTSRLFVGGAQVGSNYTDSNNYLANTGTNGVAIGYSIGDNNFNFTGYLQDFRITKGSNRGVTGTTMTVPTAPAPLH